MHREICVVCGRILPFIPCPLTGVHHHLLTDIFGRLVQATKLLFGSFQRLATSAIRRCSPRQYWHGVLARPRFFAAVTSVLAVIGITLCWFTYKGTNPGYLLSEMLNTAPENLGRPPLFTDIDGSLPMVIRNLRRAVVQDIYLVAGLSFLYIAVVILFLALVRPAAAYQKLKKITIAIVAIAISTSIVENYLIYNFVPIQSRSWPWREISDRFWIDVTACVGAFKCAAQILILVLALVTVRLLVRALWAHCRARRFQTRNNESNWWDGALHSESPVPVPAQEDQEGAWRQAYDVPDALPLVLDNKSAFGPTALCLSGGGIRSACVSMGAMQIFADHKSPAGCSLQTAPELDGFDWIISVSGGGFSSGARVLAVQEAVTAASGGKDGGASKASDSKTGDGEVTTRVATARLSERFSPGSVEFEHMRRKAAYIASSPLGLSRVGFQMMGNYLLSATAVYWSAVVLGIPLGLFVAAGPVATVIPREDTSWLRASATVALVTVAVPLVIGAALCAVSWFLSWLYVAEWSIPWRLRFANAGRAVALFALPLLALTVVGPELMWLVQRVLPDMGTTAALTAILVVVIMQFLITFFMLLPLLIRSSLMKFIPPGMIRIFPSIVAIPLLFCSWILVLAIVAGQISDYILSSSLSVRNLPFAPQIYSLVLDSVVSLNGLFIVLVVVTAVLSFLDVTWLSLHDFYRRRLSRAFAVRRVSERGRQKAANYSSEEMLWLDTHGRVDGGPKFVFAAAAAISDGEVRPPHGLNAISFVMTSDYIGGPQLGWWRTKALRAAAPPRIKRDLTVDTAMAVSGSAIATTMGRHGAVFHTLSALSGARLGTWLPNPRFARRIESESNNPWFPKALPSVRGISYLYRELFDFRSTDAPLVQVTDGGHYENLGLIEALRRRCRLIYCIDGGRDTALSGLTDAVRLAKFELGVEITPDTGDEFGVQNLEPGSGDAFDYKHAFSSLNGRITKAAVITARIEYPAASGLPEDARVGWLVLAKAVLWQELPHWVMAHAASTDGAAFPRDPTSDQWFTEARFAAYTEVGRQIAMAALRADLGALPPPEVLAGNGHIAAGRS